MLWRNALFIQTDLHLLRDYLSELTATPYFNQHLEAYTGGIIQIVDFVIKNEADYSRQIRDRFCNLIWLSSKYLSGSISSEIPYEVEFSLRIALKKWTNRDTVITTALVNERDFHFVPLDPWQQIKIIIPEFDFAKVNFNALLIQIALPRLYKHRPLYNVALYHELGHFVDTTLRITQHSLLSSPGTAGLPIHIEKSHRMEYFADLFAANYVGQANSKLLSNIAENAPVSPTHPATASRNGVIDDFLNGVTNPIVELFNNSLSTLGVPELKKRYTRPNIEDAFNNIRPYQIKNENELHGLLEAAWNFLEDALEKKREPWASLDEQEIGRIVNDLTEKSIRNMAIWEKWNGASK